MIIVIVVVLAAAAGLFLMLKKKTEAVTGPAAIPTGKELDGTSLSPLIDISNLSMDEAIKPYSDVPIETSYLALVPSELVPEAPPAVLNTKAGVAVQILRDGIPVSTMTEDTTYVAGVTLTNQSTVGGTPFDAQVNLAISIRTADGRALLNTSQQVYLVAQEKRELFFSLLPKGSWEITGKSTTATISALVTDPNGVKTGGMATTRPVLPKVPPVRIQITIEVLKSGGQYLESYLTFIPYSGVGASIDPNAPGIGEPTANPIAKRLGLEWQKASLDDSEVAATIHGELEIVTPSGSRSYPPLPNNDVMTWTWNDKLQKVNSSTSIKGEQFTCDERGTYTATGEIYVDGELSDRKTVQWPVY